MAGPKGTEAGGAEGSEAGLRPFSCLLFACAGLLCDKGSSSIIQDLAGSQSPRCAKGEGQERGQEGGAWREGMGSREQGGREGQEDIPLNQTRFGSNRLKS